MTLSADSCIQERTDEHGYIWTYRHSHDEPNDTLEAAIMIAGDVASDQAVKEGRTYIVASMVAPAVAIYVLPFGHPMIVNHALSIMYQLTPPMGGASEARKRGSIDCNEGDSSYNGSLLAYAAHDCAGALPEAGAGFQPPDEEFQSGRPR